jgi:F0F1-type ATP synthase assembly protein I
MASQPPSPPRNRGGFSRQAALAMELPFLIAGATVIGGFLGYVLDRSLHTKPWLMLVLGAAGFAVGVRDLIRRLGKDDIDGSGNPPQ